MVAYPLSLNGRHLGYVLMIGLWLLLMACTGTRETVNEIDRSSGTWVYHRGGVVCKGHQAQPVDAPAVYVSPDGDDHQRGTSPDEAFATLAHALCNAAPGQTVYVAPGRYEESILLSEFGQKGVPIRIVGQSGPNGEKPVLDGGRHFTYGIAIIGEDEAHKSYSFVVENLEFANYTDAGFAAITAEDITLRNSILRDNGFHGMNPENNGEGMGADFVEVIGLVVDGVEGIHNGPEDAVWQQGILGGDISVWGSQDVVVRNCTTHDTIGNGLLFEDTVHALAEDNRFTHALLTAPHEEVDGAIWVDGGHDILIRHNVVADNQGPGLQISDEEVQHPYGYVFEGNIVTGNQVGVFIWNFGVCPWPDESIVKMVDNVFRDNRDGVVRCEPWGCGEGQPCR